MFKCYVRVNNKTEIYYETGLDMAEVRAKLLARKLQVIQIIKYRNQLLGIKE